MNVFIIPFHVKAMKNSIMPPNFDGAYVSCYSAGETYVEATERALKKLANDGLYPEEILQPIHEMNVDSWLAHATENWPDQLASLPTQESFEASIKSDDVVYGPFGSYKPK